MNTQLNETQSLIARLDAAKQAADEAKKIENELRLEVAKTAFGYDDTLLQKGTRKYDMPDGWVAKMTFSLSAKVDQEYVNEARAQLIALDTPTPILNELFKYKVTVDEKAYKMLNPEAQKVVDQIRTFKPSMPQFKLVEPKVKK